MRVRPLAFAFALALALFAPAVHAQGAAIPAPPPDAHATSAGNFTAVFWTEKQLDADAAGEVYIHVTAMNGTPLGAYQVVANSTLLHFRGPQNGTVLPNVTKLDLGLPFDVDLGATGNVSYSFVLQVGPPGNSTSLTGTGTVLVRPFVAPPAGGLPATWLWGGGAALLVVAGVVAYQVRERRLRARMRGESRSRALREQELERLAQKRPEQAAQIKQEIRQEEQVREKRRETQILEAKRADVEKQLDMLRKRHEAGQLSKHQFDNMAGKRHAELVKIDEEIQAFEREG